MDKPRPPPEDMRAGIERDLRACFGNRLPRHRVNAIVQDLLVYERQWWTPSRINATRLNPLFHQIRDIPVEFGGKISTWGELYFGRNRRPRKGWAIRAITIAGMMLRALEDADRRAHRTNPPRRSRLTEDGPRVVFVPHRQPFRPQQGFGRADGPIIKFIRLRIISAARRAPGVKVPALATIRRVLRTAAEQ
jgi:hypothetical protein